MTVFSLNYILLDLDLQFLEIYDIKDLPKITNYYQ